MLQYEKFQNWFYNSYTFLWIAKMEMYCDYPFNETIWRLHMRIQFLGDWENLKRIKLRYVIILPKICILL